MKKIGFFLIAFITILVAAQMLLITQDANVAALDSTGLIGRWNCDEGTGSTLYDSSSNQNHGTIHSAGWTDGISSTALAFNGVDNYVEIPNTEDFNGLTQLGVSIWFYVDTFDIWEPLLNKGYTNEGITDVFEINVDGNGYISMVLNFETRNRQTYTTEAGTVSAGTWHHLAASFDGDRLKLYIDAELLADHDVYNEPLKTSNASLFIGVEYEYPDESYFNGMIDEVYIFSRPLTYAEVLELHSSYHTLTPSCSSTCSRSNQVADRSIFGGVLPRTAIPAVATVISIATISLWQLFGSLIVDFLSDFTSEKIIDWKGTKKNFSEKLDKITIPHLPMSTSEAFNLFVASAIFSFAMSWAWSINLVDFLLLFVLNLIIVGVLFSFRELFRVEYSKIHNIATHHIIWPFGAVLTIISTFLGNTFSLASNVTADNEEDKHFSRMLFFSTIIFFGVALGSFLIYLVTANVVFQMTFIFCMMTIMIDMTPLSPMDGANIRKWNLKYYLVLYAAIIVSYIFMLFAGM